MNAIKEATLFIFKHNSYLFTVNDVPGSLSDFICFLIHSNSSNSVSWKEVSEVT